MGSPILVANHPPLPPFAPSLITPTQITKNQIASRKTACKGLSQSMKAGMICD